MYPVIDIYIYLYVYRHFYWCDHNIIPVYVINAINIMCNRNQFDYRNIISVRYIIVKHGLYVSFQEKMFDAIQGPFWK